MAEKPILDPEETVLDEEDLGRFGVGIDDLQVEKSDDGD